MLKSKGLLAICEEHGKPFRTCFREWKESLQGRGLHAGGRLWRRQWRHFLRVTFGEEKGCSFPDCSKLPAIFWVNCPCKCGLSQRVCRRHRSYRAFCSEVNVPPNGTGTVYRQQVKKI